ncbi:hypothetical protein BH20VER2_BH20VER2_05920 [soil metagenome]|nr:hypothetical protein [Chthoniobacterales bacterium]
MRPIGPILAAVLLVFCTGCASTPSHTFTEPAASAWQTKTGQLAYTDQQTSIIGEVVVRSTRDGDFEMTFTKAGGITLLSLRQDAQFGRIEGVLARGGWSGPIAQAPPRARGWLQLRDKIVHARRMATVRHDAGEQTFTLRF